MHSILIVDDNSIVRRSLRMWIEQNDEWEVCGEAEDGQIAVEKVKELNPDVVILDFQMPVMNGLQAARHIKSHDPRIGMLLFTLHGCDEIENDAREAGIQHIISKSDNVGDHLLMRLRDVCSQLQPRS